MTKLDAGLMTSLPVSDPGSTAVWGSKRINPRPQSCLCLTWSGYPSNDDDEQIFTLYKSIKLQKKKIRKVSQCKVTKELDLFVLGGFCID